MTDTSDKAIEALIAIEECGGTSDLGFTGFAPMLRALQAERATMTVDASKTPDPATNAPSCQQSSDYVRGLEDAARVARRNAPNPIGGPFSHPNIARVTAFNIEKAILALIATQPTPADPVREAAKVLLAWWNQEGPSDARKIVAVIQAIIYQPTEFDKFNEALRALAGDADKGGV